MSPSQPPGDGPLWDGRQSLRVLGVPVWGLVCALALLAAILVAHPYAEVGISDDFSYVRSAEVLAQTGHVAYNGGATAILGWQLYLAAAFIKLFGFSFTTTRASILFVSVITTFLCQRTFVRAGINEWNASIGAITLMLSPLLMPLEVTFMSDMPGLFAVVVCAYVCLRAIQTANEWAAVGWIGVAAISNVVLGSSRQIAWLGVLVMVPSAAWILRRSRRVVLAGVGSWVVSVGLIFAINYWFQHQPYRLAEPLFRGPMRPHVVKQLFEEWVRATLEMVLLLLPLLLMYLPALRSRKLPWVVYVLGGGFVFYGLRMWRAHNVYAWFAPYLSGDAPFSSLGGFRLVLTLVVLVCVLATLTAVLVRRKTLPGVQAPVAGWADRQIAVLLVPFALAYVGLVCPRAGFENIWDRYLLPLLFVAVIFILRFYQERFQPRVPVAALVLAICFGAYATASLHDRMELYRARGAALNEVLASGVPATSVTGGWDYDGWTELHVSDHIYDARMLVPAGVQLAPQTHYGLTTCPWFYCTMFPHVVPKYAISLRPDAGLGDKFAPVQFHMWINPSGTIYVVRFPDVSVGGGLP